MAMEHRLAAPIWNSDAVAALRNTRIVRIGDA
jgi:hypothetical protein